MTSFTNPVTHSATVETFKFTACNRHVESEHNVSSVQYMCVAVSIYM